MNEQAQQEALALPEQQEQLTPIERAKAKGVMFLANVAALDPDEVQAYWQTLYMHDKLKDRFADIAEPTWTEVRDVIARKGKFMFNMFDPKRDEIVGDLMFQQFFGKQAMIHFSVSPLIPYREKIEVIKNAVDEVLHTWKGKGGLPFVNGLFGITPFKHAVSILKKVGFKQVDIFEDSIHFVKTDTYVDGYFLRIKRKEENKLYLKQTAKR